MHWLSAPAMLGCIGSVLAAQQAEKKDKGTWMFRYKSLGLLTGILVAPRLASKIMSRNPGKLPGSSALEDIASKVSHYSLYAFMTIMPATGIAMGYYGGKGLPFFTTTIPGAEKPDGATAKQAFSIHKTMGVYGKYLFPIHIGAAFLHAIKGQAIFYRIGLGAAPVAVAAATSETTDA